jgi:hypothetical protein
MLHMELPHINVLSKIDLIENYGNLGTALPAAEFSWLLHVSIYSSFLLAAFNLNFYTDVEDLSYLQRHLDQDPRSAKYR